jgi:hypothetical protein
LNKFTYLWDGEGLFIEEFLKLYGKYSKYLGDPKKAKRLFARKVSSFVNNKFE